MNACYDLRQAENPDHPWQDFGSCLQELHRALATLPEAAVSASAGPEINIGSVYGENIVTRCGETTAEPRREKQEINSSVGKPHNRITTVAENTIPELLSRIADETVRQTAVLDYLRLDLRTLQENQSRNAMTGIEL